MSDRAFIAGIAAAVAQSTGAQDTVRCGTDGCRYAVHAASPARAQALYGEHLRTDPRHTGGGWIDRDGRERVGLGYASGGKP